ncbi:helix-turn-helix domain-containing protein [Amycolatopsis sp., V23-08]|uniref:Helix-turn-helix domain-containing protein n=1 Tax=Amycolatopsis heterodermiae TaxID=3110235 RepID=A0ABU5RBL9_9PSEU|nr:helix-turn-helix domain-containing protein [Amycolatopsis sp., V23-08]MEA5362616.1 helix-turn-helix domain-containing protein [Amycolatopsis sp., V23-08]
MSARETSSLIRGLRILESIAVAGKTNVEDLAARTGVPISTAYRYMRSLREHDYLTESGGLYSLGTRFALDPHRGGSGHLVQMADAVLRSLRQRTGQTAVLTVRVGSSALCLDRAVSPTPDYAPPRGTVLALDADASTTPLLAFAPASLVQDIADRQNRSAESIFGKLGLIRERGCDVTRGRPTPDTVVVGAPVFREGRCVCAVSVLGPGRALHGAALDRVVRMVRDAAGHLTGDLASADGAVAWIALENQG